MERRAYPENSYAALGSIAVGMMGIEPDARERVVGTRPRLVEQNEWVEMGNIPILDTTITLRHVGNKQTTLTNLGGRAFYWRAAFPGRIETLVVDGKEWPTEHSIYINGEELSSTLLRVGKEESHTVKIKG